MNDCTTTRSLRDRSRCRPADELLARVGAEHALGERAVGLLQHARQAELADDVVGARAAHDHRRRDREIEPLRELDEVDLVAAADDRFGIVDHHHAFGPRAAREAVGVVVDVGRLADEQRVELGDPAVVVAIRGTRRRSPARAPPARSASAPRGSTARERSSSFARIARSCSYWTLRPERPAGPRRAKWFSITWRRNGAVARRQVADRESARCSTAASGRSSRTSRTTPASAAPGTD